MLVADVVAERRVDVGLARSVQREAGVHLGRAQAARDDADDVHVLSLEVLARVHEGVGPLDAGVLCDRPGNRRRQQPRRGERAGPAVGHHELVRAEQGDDAVGLVAQVCDRARHQQRQPERERGRDHGQHEAPAAMEEIEQPDAPHPARF